MKTENTSGTVSPDAITPDAEALDWKRILVPLDFSEASLKVLNYAVPLARGSGGKLVLLHIVQFPILPTPAVTGGAIGEVKAAHKALTQQAKLQLDTIAKRTAAAGLVAHRIVTAGLAWDEIVKAAKRLECDLVLISTHGHAGIKRMLSNHTAEHVVRMAPCPVLCMRC